MQKEFENSLFWKELTTNLIDFHDEYHMARKHDLLIQRDYIPKIKIKSFNSFLKKTYRKNILDNKNFPKEPESGWILPSNWYSKIKDILRTLVIVKYLDGVEFFLEKISENSTSCGVKCNHNLEARIDGYYAAHVYTEHMLELPVGIKTENYRVTFEIQITTQLQELIRELIHEHYEKKKILRKIENDWQWDYKSEEFSSNYLGHILHYVEGMIMEIREKEKGIK